MQLHRRTDGQQYDAKVRADHTARCTIGWNMVFQRQLYIGNQAR